MCSGSSSISGVEDEELFDATDLREIGQRRCGRSLYGLLTTGRSVLRHNLTPSTSVQPTDHARRTMTAWSGVRPAGRSIVSLGQQTALTRRIISRREVVHNSVGNRRSRGDGISGSATATPHAAPRRASRCPPDPPTRRRRKKYKSWIRSCQVSQLTGRTWTTQATSECAR